jgi:two-component system response regulator QseB
MNILFIEDDPMNRRVVKDMLDVAGATMAEASWAEEGLARIDAESFDVVLVDLRMPGTDGFETIRRIRARDDEKGKLPIIVVTADTAVDLRERCSRPRCRRRAVQAGGDGRAVRFDRPRARQPRRRGSRLVLDDAAVLRGIAHLEIGYQRNSDHRGDVPIKAALPAGILEPQGHIRRRAAEDRVGERIRQMRRRVSGYARGRARPSPPR